MKLIIHRGAEQIGGNIIEISTENTKIILDCGRNLPPLDDPKAPDDIEIPGLTHGKSEYDGVFITHYHADHCGLIERINTDIPIYMSNKTQIMLNTIADFINAPLPRVSQVLESGTQVTLGDLTVLPIRVRHSAKGALAYLVEADGQKLLYTGDFNHIDEMYHPLMGAIDVLLCEGTNIGAHHGLSEKDIEREATRVMRETKGQVFVLCSTTNIDRVKSVEKACQQSGRTMAIDPFMNAIMDRVGHALCVNQVGFVPHFIHEERTPRVYKYLMSDIHKFTSTETVAKMTNLTFMVRQTMGGFLKRLHSQTPLTGSTLIYSMWRGYENTKDTKTFLDLCQSIGIKIKYLHASGHAYREVLKSTILKLKPKVVVPIHTESAEQFREMYDSVTLLQDGEVLDV